MMPVTSAPVNIRPLTALRFLAALWVILYSYWAELGLGPNPNFVQSGNLGVDLFFILSGFILSHVYLEDFGAGRFSYREFIIHRIARIYPLHIVTHLVAICLGLGATLAGFGVDPHVLDWASLPAHLSMTQAWGLAQNAAFNHPSWSISAEWSAYLCFPLYGAIAWRLRERPIVAVGLALMVVALVYTVFFGLTGKVLIHGTFQWGVLRIVPTFFLGCMLYLAYRKGAVTEVKTSLMILGLALIGTGVAIGFNLGNVMIVACLGFIVLALGGVDPEGKSFMSSKVMVYLGEVSFSLYMIYVPFKWVFLKLIDKGLGLDGGPLPLLWWLMGYGLMIPTAMVAHHMVEKPMRGVIRRLGERMIKVRETKLTAVN
jgi:peptidoglycan/LPS O-acetylase OafA/YrhL